jgi:DNA-binding transcriptional LysR family regulator
MVNPDWLRYFVTLAETRNFHAAAEQLHMTPQALSKAIAGLEAHYKLTLVDRGHRVKGLTGAGEAFLEEARAVLRRLEETDRRMAEWRSPAPIGPVAIAGLDVWVHYFAPTRLPQLLAEHPGVVPRFYNMLPEDVVQWVVAGDVDLGLLLAPPSRADLAWARGPASPYVIAARPQPVQRWDAFGYVVPRFFRREPAMPLDGWPEAEFPRRVVAEVEMLETAVHLLEAGVGAAFLPAIAIQDRLERGSLAVVAEAPIAFEDRLHVVWRKGVRLTPAAGAVLTALGIEQQADNRV